jgi:hypothetical protein
LINQKDYELLQQHGWQSGKWCGENVSEREQMKSWSEAEEIADCYEEIIRSIESQME